MTPEETARQRIDEMLTASGWLVQTKITALQLLYSRPCKQRLTEHMLKELETKLKSQFGAHPVDTLSLSIEPEDFDYAPFSQHCGLGKAHQLFGDKLLSLLDELNQTLAA